MYKELNATEEYRNKPTIKLTIHFQNKQQNNKMEKAKDFQQMVLAKLEIYMGQ